MVFAPLKFNDNLIAQKPIIQGGMAIRVSSAPLAAAVANCGGVGVIAASGLPEPELRAQIRLAKSLQKNKDGLIAVNIMFAASEFRRLIEISVDEGIDLIISGAGFSRDLFSIGKEKGIQVVPIVSSVKLARISKKLGASVIIVESGEAGGHLGTDEPIRKLIPEIRQALDEEPDIPNVGKVRLVAAGGVTCGCDILEMMELGASGVQMATRFVLSKECDVHDNFKELFLNKEEKDVIMMQSPVGLPARALLTPLTQRLKDGTIEGPKSCDSCLKHCSHAFCIMKALEAARNGDIENGLFFTGANLKKYTEILSVKEIFESLESEAEEYKNKNKIKCEEEKCTLIK
jgi:NAD(P)H-dependent flavin oxidoreductase YrpB (nitropropane dioxygenase family)